MDVGGNQVWKPGVKCTGNRNSSTPVGIKTCGKSASVEQIDLSEATTQGLCSFAQTCAGHWTTILPFLCALS